MCGDLAHDDHDGHATDQTGWVPGIVCGVSNLLGGARDNSACDLRHLRDAELAAVHLSPGDKSNRLALRAARAQSGPGDALVWLDRERGDWGGRSRRPC